MVVSVLFFGNLGELIPDLEPSSVVLINTLTADFDLNVADQSVAKRVGPGDVVGFISGAGGINGPNGKRWELHLEVNVVNKIPVTGNGASNFATKVCGAGEHLFNRLNCEVCMSTIDHFENVGTPSLLGD